MTLEEIRKQLATVPSGKNIVANDAKNTVTDDVISEFCKDLESKMRQEHSKVTSEIVEIKFHVRLEYSNPLDTICLCKIQHI